MWLNSWEGRWDWFGKEWKIRWKYGTCKKENEKIIKMGAGEGRKNVNGGG